VPPKSDGQEKALADLAQSTATTVKRGVITPAKRGRRRGRRNGPRPQGQAVASSDMETPGQRAAALAKSLGNILIAVSALGVLLISLWSLRDVWHSYSRPVDAAFTRVGGTTSVETAVQASRFWLTPPQFVVEAWVGTKLSIMLGAAQCAMVHDAPLLFTLTPTKQQPLVEATITNWRMIAKFEHRKTPNVLQYPSDAKLCMKNRDPADVNGLSTLAVPNPLIPLPPTVPARQSLASVVVFAAAIAPGHAPDVAVGLALAAHMVRADGKVSLVVVPNYLEADPELERLLQNQHEPVMGGVVLGQTPTVPEDTRVLLRQLLASTDQQGLLAQLQASLAALGSVITAFLAIFATGVVIRVAPEIGHQAAEAIRQVTPSKISGEPPVEPDKPPVEPDKPPTKPDKPPVEPDTSWAKLKRRLETIANMMGVFVPNFGKKHNGEPTALAPDQCLTLLGDVGEKTVTVWLRSGWTLTGTIKGQHGSGAGQSQDRGVATTVTVLRLNGARLARGDGQPEQAADFVLVQIADIELIGVAVREPAPPGGKPT
jgi:hypothetical protein